jgi:cyclic-di-AMP phosphodiesterase PgpH
MPTVAKLAKRERPPKSRFRKLLESIRADLTWLDLLVGVAAGLIISGLLVGFRYQSIPDLKVGSIANQDVRALQDVTYIDRAATEQRAQAARTAIPAIYELDTNLISGREAELSKAFSASRDLLGRKKIPPKGELRRIEEQQILQELEREVGAVLPPSVLPVLLRQRFNPELEGQVLKVLDTVMRAGIVSDRAQFLRDQRSGITLRDTVTPLGRPVTDAYMVRDLPGSREFLRQFHLEFSALPAQDRAAVIQFMEGVLTSTLTYRERETSSRRESAAALVPPVEVQIRQGKAIVRAGEEVNESTVTQLEALRNLQRPRSLVRQSLGFLFFVLVFVYSMWRYFVFYQTRHRKIRSHTVLILSIMVVLLGVIRILTALADILSERISLDLFHDPFNLYYAIPFAFGTVLVTLLVDTNLGIMNSVITAALVGLFYGDVHLACYALVGCFVGIYSVRQYKDRAAILKAGLTIGLMNWIGLIGIDLLRLGPFQVYEIPGKLGVALVSGILTSTLASMLLPILEWVFKVTTDVRLLELSNMNAPVLRRLSVEAPGTYHHSLMVGTLAEAASEAIGANPLLARVGAYYHDIGKMLKPEYFVENQVFGINKHETLSPSMSCLIIASHVKDGLELAREIGLSKKISDMIPQHHGTRVMTYFYQKAKDSIDLKNQEVEEVDFRYPGPKPQSKEAAIIMMADSVEAASRTLSNPTPAQIQGMISRLVDAIVADDQFDECDITLRDIRLVKESFLKILSGLYHRRIDYPGYDFSESGIESEKLPLQNSGPRPAKAF